MKYSRKLSVDLLVLGSLVLYCSLRNQAAAFRSQSHPQYKLGFGHRAALLSTLQRSRAQDNVSQCAKRMMKNPKQEDDEKDTEDKKKLLENMRKVELAGSGDNLSGYKVTRKAWARFFGRIDEALGTDFSNDTLLMEIAPILPVVIFLVVPLLLNFLGLQMNAFLGSDSLLQKLFSRLL